jgi:parvulin-like peptidyl-prolyl isomerase
MQRTTTVIVGLSFVLAIALLGTLARSPAEKTTKTAPSAAAPVVSAASAAPVVEAPPAMSAAELQLPEDVPNPSGFDQLPDGSKAPPLPDSAPQTVRFGVVLVNYRGAQFAGVDSRDKAEAQKRALAVIADAKKDFAAAASKGDRGSTADAGRIPRGILEPAVEYALFMLPKGEVYPQPIDTPRGFWVIRRID